MRKLRKRLLKIFLTIASLYVLVCGLMYFFQENLIFFPQKLDKEYAFPFEQDFEEVTVKTEDETELHGLLFKAEDAKGLIFYLHGNAGSVASWGSAARSYVDLNYDVFMLDYRGYGKSEGDINSEKQLFDDMQSAYNEMLKRYDESQIIVLGYSIGTGPATHVASANAPKMLILQAPYYSLVDMMEHRYPIIPTFILKYRFETNRYVKDCKMPVVIFHGDEDRVIYYGSSVKLKKIVKDARLITLKGWGHNGMTDSPQYMEEIAKVLQ